MASAVTILVVVAAALLMLSLLAKVCRGRCPNYGRRRLRFVGLASEWSTECVESRFPEVQCGACGRNAVCRAGLLGRWEPARHAEPETAAADPAS